MSLSSNAFAPPLFFVINAGSGRHDPAADTKVIRAAMEQAARPYEIFVITRSSSLERVIQQAVDLATSSGGAVVAVGGDGTINAVASAALAGHCLFGALPRGTFNYFGRTHGIPEELEGALEDLLEGTPVPIQVGLVNDRVFLVNASVGLYPELLEDREQFKQRFGRSRVVAFWSAVVTAFGDHRYLDMVLELGGTPTHVRTTTLFIGNNQLQLEQVGMPEAESLERGQLAAIAVNPVGTGTLLWLAARGALGRLGEADNVTSFSFRSLTVAPLGLWRGRRARIPNSSTRPGQERKARIKVAVDGEILWMQAPLEFRVGPESLSLIKRNASSRARSEGP